MSRVGNQPIPIPDGVKVTYNSRSLKVKGPKGELSRDINPNVDLGVNDDFINVIPSGMKQARAMQGLTRTLVANMMVGVTQGFERGLEVIGVGYRVALKENVLTLTLGYSHPVVYKLPEGISASIDKKNKIVLSGIDKELLGVTAATIREFRRPEPYKGKGIKYVEEQIRRKVGKSAGK
jgi:large subunit ribosomal protein L6